METSRIVLVLVAATKSAKPLEPRLNSLGSRLSPPAFRPSPPANLTSRRESIASRLRVMATQDFAVGLERAYLSRFERKPIRVGGQ